ncbi:excinuclease ABC subunit UvrA [Silvibacterium dinghuense]|uniref:UvrABC system protein A n=1 Tax=Silvibacterium dinghuense TaxID=1560006 RepID=A0A4Q1S753_9BACT|nr:excinuclease ABC subunit UvrA [Silvibacterium dinghuense]RXS92805.1 excinuclease ABC subunit A [Silvibacterium dinghuense]GGH17480.1 UvrABC system protein A [Silvibacterium dinghuense]
MSRAGFVCVRGAREHNLKSVDVDIPRDALVVFTGVSGSGKSSLAFGTLYAEAQRRYLESVSPYVRRLFHQLGVPDVDRIDGLPPAIALQQQRGTPTTRSSVGSVTTISNLFRMLYSRAGHYRKGRPMLYAESFTYNLPEGACPVCHGQGRIYEVTEESMVPDPSLTIRERAVAAWPTAWQGQNLRDILVTLGYDVDRSWKNLSDKDRQWILFTEDQPTVPVYAGLTPAETRRALRAKMEPSYQGTFTSARRYVMETFTKSHSAMMKKRVSAFMLSTECPSCHGERLRADALEVTFAGLNIAQMGNQSLKATRSQLMRYASGEIFEPSHTAEKIETARTITKDIVSRLDALVDLGVGYLSLERNTATLSPGELQRVRLATQLHSNLFGVIYVLDEPSAGLHPADTQTLLRALDALKRAGNSLFVVEHEIDVIEHADWIVDVGPGAGSNGGEILYSGEPHGLVDLPASQTARYVFGRFQPSTHDPRSPKGWLRLKGITRNNLHGLDVAFPLGVLTSVTGVSGSGKSTLVSQVLVDLVSESLGQAMEASEPDEEDVDVAPASKTEGRIVEGARSVKRLVRVDQRPIGRTPRSNMATYTGLFDHVRKLFAETEMARARGYDAGRFSFNVAKGRCETCQGEGFVMVELLFLPSVYSPCPTCHGARFNAETLEVTFHDKSIADVLNMTVVSAAEFFQAELAIARSLNFLLEVGLGYLRLGQPATELSGGEAQRIKLATELQRPQRGDTLYVLDEPTTGLHPADVERLLVPLNRLIDLGNTVVLVEQDMYVVASSDWVIDIGPGAGDEGGKIVAQGTPWSVADGAGRTAPYLRRFLRPLKN